MQELIIEPGRAERQYWADLWRYRELFQVLAWRDISVRYKQTVIGAAWALLRPVLAMVVFTIVFGAIARLPSEPDVPYALMVFAGLLPWSFFSTAFSDAANSMIGNANLVSKIYFPRLIVPASAVMTGFVDFLIGMALLAVLLVWYRFVPSWHLVVLPFFVALVVLLSVGLGAWVATLNVRYRDFRFIVPVALQLALYVSPVGFTSAVVPAQWRLLYSLNPLAGIIDGFRWCIFGGAGGLYLPGVVLSIAVTALLLWFGLRQFRKLEKSIADFI